MKAEDVKKAAVIGAGVMGHSIAQVYAAAGIEVNLVDSTEKALERARGLMEINLANLADFKKIRRKDVKKILGRIHPSTDIAKAVVGLDVVVEAVVEVPDVKRQVFKAISDHCPEEAVIASNSSGLDIFSLAEVRNPERFVAQHWFAPPHLVPLVEIAPGAQTSAETVAFSEALMRRLGKKPVVMKKFVQSYIVNRIQGYIAMAFYEILEKGWATPEAIDLAVKTSLGIRLPIIGVVQSQDFNGLDLAYDIQKNLGIIYSCVKDRVDAGNLGVKTGKGFYDYDGRSEAEILKKRDKLFIALNEFLEEIKAFEPV